MSESHYNRLVSELKNIQNKASNAHLRVFGNKVNAFVQKATAIVQAIEANKLQTAHIQQLKQSMLNPQEIADFQSAGLNEGDFKRLEELINVLVRNDYKELEELRENGQPDAFVAVRSELDEVLKENSRLAEEIEHMLLREKMITAAADLENQHPGTIAAIKRVLNQL